MVFPSKAKDRVILEFDISAIAEAILKACESERIKEKEGVYRLTDIFDILAGVGSFLYSAILVITDIIWSFTQFKWINILQESALMVQFRLLAAVFLEYTLTLVRNRLIRTQDRGPDRDSDSDRRFTLAVPA